MIQPQPGRKDPKPAKSKWLPITEEEEPGAYEILEKQLVHHPDLRPARFTLVWLLHVTPDTDGHLVLGVCKKAPPLWQKIAGIDFVIGLNRDDFWIEADVGQRSFVMDHELCHAAPSIDAETGDQKIDDQGDLLWRTKKHDIEEFFGPVSRHGLRMGNLHRFYQVAREAQLALPYSATGADLESDARPRSVEEAVEGLRPDADSDFDSIELTQGGVGVRLNADGSSERIESEFDMGASDLEKGA